MTFHVRYAFQSASDRAATCFPTAVKKSGCSKFNYAKRNITRSARCCKSVLQLKAAARRVGPFTRQ